MPVIPLDLWDRITYAAGQAWENEKKLYGFGGDDPLATSFNVAGKVGGSAIAFTGGSSRIIYSAGGRVASRAGLMGGLKAALGGTGIGAVVAFLPDAYALTSGFIRGWNEYGE